MLNWRNEGDQLRGGGKRIIKDNAVGSQRQRSFGTSFAEHIGGGSGKKILNNGNVMN